MPIVRAIATGLLTRGAARRLTRIIPNPLMRTVAVVAATAIIPAIIEKVASRRQAQKERRGERGRQTLHY